MGMPPPLPDGRSTGELPPDEGIRRKFCTLRSAALAAATGGGPASHPLVGSCEGRTPGGEVAGPLARRVREGARIGRGKGELAGESRWGWRAADLRLGSGLGAGVHLLNHLRGAVHARHGGVGWRGPARPNVGQRPCEAECGAGGW
jgi:hypothetical protein